MINQQVLPKTRYWGKKKPTKNKTKTSEARRKMQKLTEDKQNRPATSRAGDTKNKSKNCKKVK
jgi:hypothetical protein